MKNKLNKKTNALLFYHLADAVAPEKDSNISNVEVLRCGTIHDRELDITAEMLSDYVKNFKDNVYGTEIQVNCEHMRGSEAAGWVKDLYIDGDKLMCTVEWTEMGVEKITKKLFKFVSAELAYKYPHHQTGSLVSNVFIGLALTNTPALKGQDALSLNEQLIKLLNDVTMFKKFLQSLKERAIVSKEDKDLMKTLLEELPADEQEAVKSEVAEVDAKPEVAEKTAEEIKAEEDAKVAADKAVADAAAAAGDQKTPEETLKEKDIQMQSLQEKLNASENEKTLLAEKLRIATLTEESKTKFLISKDRKVGVQEADLQAVTNFVATLSEEQSKAFNEVFNKIRAVDMTTLGEGGGDANETEEQKLEKADKEAEELSQKSGRTKADCLAEIYKLKGLAK